MLCVSCGFCCKTMSPINDGYCPLLLVKGSETGDIYYCSDYKNRPEQCKNHSMPAKVCPIGKETLKLINDNLLNKRINDIHNVLISEFGYGIF